MGYTLILLYYPFFNSLFYPKIYFMLVFKLTVSSDSLKISNDLLSSSVKFYFANNTSNRFSLTFLISSS